MSEANNCIEKCFKAYHKSTGILVTNFGPFKFKTQFLIEDNILAFRSSTIEDVFCNFFIPFGSALEIAVDFYNCLSEVSKDIQYVTGHSLGGAIAIEYTERINKYKNPEIKCFSFGSPISSKNNNISCYQNGNDWATKFSYNDNVIHIGPERKWWKISWTDHRLECYRDNIGD